jgi:hypothetical protein
MTHDINFYEISFTNESKIPLTFAINNALISHGDDMTCHVMTMCYNYSQHHDSWVQQNMIHAIIR